jgi:alpha-galactosidase/6-phospho-beta-glucosidase family protein
MKIVMVGGGSYGWGPQLLSDLLQAPELEGSEVVLLDPNLQAGRRSGRPGRRSHERWGDAARSGRHVKKRRRSRAPIS